MIPRGNTVLYFNTLAKMHYVIPSPHMDIRIYVGLSVYSGTKDTKVTQNIDPYLEGGLITPKIGPPLLTRIDSENDAPAYSPFDRVYFTRENPKSRKSFF